MIAKDYFQDIKPPAASAAPRPPRENIPPAPPPAAAPAVSSPQPQVPAADALPERTIRNIPVTPSRTRSRIGAEEIREGSPIPPSAKQHAGRYWLWGAVVLAALILGAIALVALRPTSVAVLPRSHTVLFDDTARFSAYRAATAATGTLTFTIETSNLEDSQVVPTQGTERVEERASGTVTVFNEYSSAPVTLLKNTRFATPDGLIFRIPAEASVPGKKGAAPGQIEITVFADAPGETYNVGPISRFTIPGLKSTPDMYTKVYARSTTAMSGGFAGERPAAAPGALDAARSEIRSRLQAKAREAALARTDGTTFAFADLARITFESLPLAPEAGGGVRIRERAHIELPLFPADAFAHVIAESVSAEAENGSVMLLGKEGFGAHAIAPPSADFGTAPLEFTLRGKAQLVWKVDAQELAKALAGRDEAAFQAIVKGLPGIEEAHARIEPFWKNTFPADPSAIKIKIEEPRPSA